MINFDLVAFGTVTQFSISDAGDVSFYVEPRNESLEGLSLILDAMVRGATSIPDTVVEPRGVAVYRALRAELDTLNGEQIRETLYTVGGSTLVH